MEWSETAVRDELRSFLEENWDPNAELLDWRNKLVDSGWGMPSWPERWFGRDMPQSLLSVVAEEFARIGAVSVARTGIRLLAAETLLAHGNDAQRERYLRKILTGEETWCQLFSEPGSGSDLAGSTTRAELVGDDWIINGQKVWTTSAHHADFGLLLARHDWDVPKHQGLSYFILDFHQEGVEVHPLKQMNGHASFNQVFFNNAKVSRSDQVGENGDGWQIAMTTLMHERRNAGNIFVEARRRGDFKGSIYEQEAEENKILLEPYTWYPQRAGRVDLVLPRAKATGAIRDPVARQEIAKLMIMSRCAEWTALRARAAQQQGQPQGPEGSLGKLAGSNIARQAATVHTLISGVDAMTAGEESPESGIVAEILLSVPAISIAGGTDEIQRNIISERVLGMQKEPRMDTGPFKDVRKS
ncbi:MAG: acyl-CoA dehydrogenase family protein [Gammaproteobacteria bacterium]|nr:acyl-CoA dehydrogenase family protein [Gammaproteobacteria bacterium]